MRCKLKDGERERERERGKVWVFNKIIGPVDKIIYIYFFSSHEQCTSIDVHCSNGAKIFRFSSTAGASF